jgi:tellurite resistance protein
MRFAHPEKRALVRLAHGLALVDSDLAGNELAAARALAAEFGVDFDDATKLGIPEAVDLLAAQPAHLEVACLVVADIFFADGRYSASEQQFTHDFAQKFHLPENLLASAVERLRRQKLDDALTAWHDEIVHGALPGPEDGSERR